VSTRTYAVFISYRHDDNKDAGRQWATWLHHSLETYEVPPDLIGRRNQRGETVPASLFPVFRDEEELSADADLSMNIRRALEHSGLLVVLCSPRAVASPYVDEEIRHFKELGKSDRTLALLIDGEPNAKDEALECLPHALRYGQPRPDGTVDWTVRTQPIAADARLDGKPAQGWTTAAAYENALEEEDALSRRQIHERTREYEKRLELAKLKVIAGALGVPLGELTKRNQVFELAKARRRTRILFTWLLIVGMLAIGAAIAGVIAYRNQREAERQKRVAEEQLDRAVRAAYLNIVRQGSSQVAAGQLAAARETLLQAPRDIRAWEWWYLMARCGPAPMTLSRLAALDPSRAAAMKSRLDAVAATPPPPDDANLIVRRSGTLVLRYHPLGGRGGTMWEVHRAAGNATILLQAFQTGMYGSLPAALLGDDGHVYWRAGEDDGTGRNPPVMVSGEQLRPMEDYVGFLRERYITGETAAGDGTGSPVWDFDRTTWPDQTADVISWSSITPEADEDAVLIVSHDRDAPVHTYDFTTSRLQMLASPQELWGDFSDLTPPRAPREPALLATAAAEDRQGGPKVDSREYHVAAERGPAGPLVLSAWRFGNLRLRDGRSGRIIGETFEPQKEPGAITYGGAAAVIPGTELVAGGFWWDGAIVVGVVDLRNRRLLARFEKAPDLNADFMAQVEGRVQVSRDGRQAAMEVHSRDTSFFAVWDVKSGKVVYGPVAAGGRIALPLAYAWHPDGRFVAIVQPDGLTELRRDFGAAPFARLEGIAPSGHFRVQEIGEKTRVLVGNGVIDTTRWETIITLPVGNYVSRDGERAVVETRPGVIEVVRPGFRRSLRNARESILAQQIRDADARNAAAPPR
jgi:hypothetical protein